MFFVWTSEGGPLQYVGMGLFLLQLLPRMFPELTTFSLLAMVLPTSVLLATLYAWQSGALVETHQLVVEWRNRLRTRLTNLVGVEWTNSGFSTFVAIVAGAFVAVLLMLDTYWVSVISQLLAMSVTVYTHFYGPAMVNNPTRRGGVETPIERASRHAKMQQITELVQSMPVEAFVSQEHIHDECTISQLKEMLKRRGVTDHELESYVDRQNLEESLVQRRKYSDMCCICFEAYEPGEPLRILPRCHHELHMECLDKWAFTFASATKRHHDPSCPLCKEKI